MRAAPCAFCEIEFSFKQRPTNRPHKVGSDCGKNVPVFEVKHRSNLIYAFMQKLLRKLSAQSTQLDIFAHCNSRIASPFSRGSPTVCIHGNSPFSEKNSILSFFFVCLRHSISELDVTKLENSLLKM